jgi:hypothetical protein
MTRGRRESLALRRMTLSFTTPRRFIPALSEIETCFSLSYWGVPDIAAAHERLLHHGAAPREAITDVGGGIKVAAVADPFGNLIGIIENPHFSVQA